MPKYFHVPTVKRGYAVFMVEEVEDMEHFLQELAKNQKEKPHIALEMMNDFIAEEFFLEEEVETDFGEAEELDEQEFTNCKRIAKMEYLGYE